MTELELNKTDRDLQCEDFKGLIVRVWFSIVWE